MKKKEDLNNKNLHNKDMKKWDLLIFIISAVIILVASYFLKLNLLYVSIGIVIVFVITYFKKSISKMFLL